MSSVFACTLDMINKDMSEYPEHRVSFFKMIQAINMNCFPALLRLPPADFSLFLDSIVWAFKHTMRDVADTGLIVCLELVNNFAASDVQSSASFFQQHYLRLLQDVFVVLTDTEHKAGISFSCAPPYVQDLKISAFYLRDLLDWSKQTLYRSHSTG
jgi:exportin-1